MQVCGTDDGVIRRLIPERYADEIKRESNGFLRIEWRKGNTRRVHFQLREFKRIESNLRQLEEKHKGIYGIYSSGNDIFIDVSHETVEEIYDWICNGE